MESLIDYAGLFPPSELPFDDAISNYKLYFSSSDSWILNRFICPISKLNNLLPHLSDFTAEKPLHLSVLLTGNFQDDTYINKFHEELSTIKTFEDQYGDVCKIKSLEAKIDTQNNNLNDILNILSTSIKSLDNSVEIFLEPIITDFSTISNQISTSNIKNIQLKLRCGGIVPEAFPSSKTIASALSFCKKNNVKLKFTAGLHHPIRHFDEEIGTKMHGFVNVFGSALLFYTGIIDETNLIEALEDENPHNFAFKNTSFSWKNNSLPVNAIVDLREEALLSYGSCSFNEPRDDLKDLGWM
ncbi:MAG: hypothetical protein BEU04_02625 [Marine Group III euryarchaeote CG-Bathy1]|uniref:Uncharacterized protein n=1 Tax=Marine Group III euryarchaeote CG-Bathy1 TaxID=1889001 RepID=A0A1J5T1Q3_9ARCH|nr:MAG: hypothetical protein BEU04_02625 [Marine Group III euryarchaeote CG-Bathy1]